MEARNVRVIASGTGATNLQNERSMPAVGDESEAGGGFTAVGEDGSDHRTGIQVQDTLQLRLLKRAKRGRLFAPHWSYNSSCPPSPHTFQLAAAPDKNTPLACHFLFVIQGVLTPQSGRVISYSLVLLLMPLLCLASLAWLLLLQGGHAGQGAKEADALPAWPSWLLAFCCLVSAAACFHLGCRF